MSVTVTAQELGLLLDYASKSPATLAAGYALRELLQRFEALANSKHRIGELLPSSVPPARSASGEIIPAPAPAEPVAGD